MSYDLPRLDVLIYAHDGRGLGHVSRSIGIGMALRRCFPELRVLFVSGSAMSGELIGCAPVDWLKLPAYRTEVVEGKSRGIDGYSGFGDRDLGLFRSLQIRDIVRLYRPRLVVCDHSPQGKHRELRDALEESGQNDTSWLLGVRGVVGAVPQAASELGRELFDAYYRGVLWYGDCRVLGREHLDQLAEFYGTTPVECGYVSRLGEMRRHGDRQLVEKDRFCCTVSVPWLGEDSVSFLRLLAGSIYKLGPGFGDWRLFIEYSGSSEAEQLVNEQFRSMDHCRVEPPSGASYMDSLLRSDAAVIYGGYNSLVDVLSCGIPALVVVREMRDNEQLIHLKKMSAFLGDRLETVSESESDPDQLLDKLRKVLDKVREKGDKLVNIRGAENSAACIHRVLQNLESEKT